MNKINFKDLEKELPVLLGWNFHCLRKDYMITSFEDLRTNDNQEALCLSYMSPNGFDCDYDFCVLIWGENKDFIIKKMKKILKAGQQNGLIDSVTPLCQEEILGYVERLKAENDRGTIFFV